MPQFEPGGSWANCATTIAGRPGSGGLPSARRSIWANWLRRRRVHEVSLEGRDEALDPTPGWAIRITVMNALERLSPDERILLGLRYGSDLEVPDIAAALGIPLGTAKSRLHRALKRLAEAMEGEMSHDDPILTAEEAAAADALRKALNDMAVANPLARPTLPGAPEQESRSRFRLAQPARRLAAAAAVALVALVAMTGFLAVRRAPGPGPSGTPPSSASASLATVSPASTRLGLGPFEPILDVAEPQITTGSAAMHESLGSASDGVVFVKDYGFSAAGGNNVYHVTLYRTFDGVQWRSITVPTPSDQQESDVACRGWNCVVVSDFPQDGSILVTDDGNHWDSVDPSPNLFQTSITAGPTGFVMSGVQVKTFESRVFFSPNGRDWQDLRFESGSQPLETGLAFSDPIAGWLLMGAYGSGSELHQAMALSNDGLTWRDVQDPDQLYTTKDLVGQAVFHFDGRWYLLARYRQMPAGYSGGGFGRPASTSTPVATWQTIYWIEDGSSILRSSGRLSTTLPDEVVAMNGYLVGARSNPDFTATLMISTDALEWTDQGLLPPGVPEPASLHGMPVYYLPQLCRAGSNGVMQGPALKPNEMGAGLYVAKPLK